MTAEMSSDPFFPLLLTAEHSERIELVTSIAAAFSRNPMILAMCAIWGCWYETKLLDFRGELYQHTLMTPMFTPTNNPYGAPRVVLAAVGPKMTEVAGEVAVSSDTSGLKFELS